VRRLLSLAILLLTASAVHAQSSQFGIRGLGLPGRAISTRAMATGGSFGLFDNESSLNPASLASTPTVTTVFTGLQEFRDVENPGGEASLRSSRFPHVLIAGPLRRNTFAIGLSFSNYARRDFSLATADTLLLRGAPVGVLDTSINRGGLNDIRLGVAYKTGTRGAIGFGLHAITGSGRAEVRRTFSDTLYQATVQRSEISYAGVGLSAGIVRGLSSQLSFAAVVCTDGDANVDRDSTRVGEIDLPYTLGAALRWRPDAKLDLAAQAIYRTWSGSNQALQNLGTVGSENTLEVSFGGEFVGDPKRPFRRPIRFGVRYGTLPFPITPGEQPHELGIALGTGTRFAQQRAGIDLTVERVWRSAGTEYSERAWLVAVGVSVRP
jgi:hypothetical protein